MTSVESMSAADLERAAGFPAVTRKERDDVKAARREIRRRCSEAGGDVDRLTELVKDGRVSPLSAIADLLR